MKKSLLIMPFILLVFCAISPAKKESIDEEGKENILESFQSVINIENQNIKVPTVVEVPISFEKEVLNSVAVVDNSNELFLPNLVVSNDETKKVIWNVLDEVTGKAQQLIDKNNDTYKEYAISNDGKISNVALKVSSTNQLIETSSLTFNFDRYVALPKTIQISVYDNESQADKIILAKTSMKSNTVNFPKTSGESFKIELEYSQPLRIREISFNPTNLQHSSKSVRFLAQPNKSYKIYYDADLYVKAETGEMPNLRGDKDILVVENFQSNLNYIYKKSDSDSDGIPDEIDNCVKIANKDQEDINKNERGDVCDDFDRDGVLNADDNCPNDPNRYQKDEDVDGIGDICDEDESRFFAKYSWLAMTLIVIVGFVVVALFLITFKKETD